METEINAHTLLHFPLYHEKRRTLQVDVQWKASTDRMPTSGFAHTLAQSWHMSHSVASPLHIIVSQEKTSPRIKWSAHVCCGNYHTAGGGDQEILSWTPRHTWQGTFAPTWCNWGWNTCDFLQQQYKWDTAYRTNWQTTRQWLTNSTHISTVALWNRTDTFTSFAFYASQTTRMSLT